MLVRTTLFAAVALFASVFTAAAQTPAAQPAAEAKPATPSTQEPFVYVQMTTSMGDIVLELNQEKAPITVDNFMKYVDEKYYDGTVFHRVISNFMIQGGGFTPDMKQKGTKKPIKNESTNGLSNARGTIAMARTQNPDTATSQFFINVQDNNNTDPKVQKANLDPRSGQPGDAVFGKVVSGMDVVDKIKAVKTGEKVGMKDVPVETVEIKSVKKLSAEEAAKYKEGEKK